MFLTILAPSFEAQYVPASFSSHKARMSIGIGNCQNWCIWQLGVTSGGRLSCVCVSLVDEIADCGLAV